MGCCSSKRAVAVGVESESIKKPKKNNVQISENTGVSVTVISPNGLSNGSTDLSPTNANNQIRNSPSFTITPKYTSGIHNSSSASDLRQRNPENKANSSPVFPSSFGYRQPTPNRSLTNNSSNLLTAADTNNILSTTYNTDHLRASPYASSLSNRKKYGDSDRNRFRGFEAPVLNPGSESDNFDSDIETEPNLPGTAIENDNGIKIKPIPDNGISTYLDLSHVNSTPPVSEVVQDQVILAPKEDEVKTLEPDKDTTRKESQTPSSEMVNDVPKESIEVRRMATPELRIKQANPNSVTNSPRNKRKNPSPAVSPSVHRKARTPEPEIDPIMETLEDAFFRFARYGEVNSEGREMNNKNWAKLCRDCEFVENRNILVGDVDVIFSRHKQKGFRLIDFEMFVKCLQEIADRKYKSITDDKKRREKVYNKVIGKAPEYVGITSISKTGNVDRMTDHSLYPTSHKMRFDEEGRGLGVDDLFSLDPTEHGYVQGYKDKDTYNLKVGRPSSRSSLRPMSREASNVSSRSGGSPKLRR